MFAAAAAVGCTLGIASYERCAMRYGADVGHLPVLCPCFGVGLSSRWILSIEGGRYGVGRLFRCRRCR